MIRGRLRNYSLKRCGTTVYSPARSPTSASRYSIAQRIEAPAVLSSGILLADENTIMSDIVTRYAKNPILTPAMILGANAVFNSSVARFANRYVGVFRVETRQGFQTLRVGWSEDGINNWKFDPDEVLVPADEPFKTYEEARYDPRITFIKEDNAYYICHASENRF